MIVRSALYVVVAYAGATVLLGWGYFLRHELVRAPLGVFNRRDIWICWRSW
jgi:hypothetical protein